MPVCTFPLYPGEVVYRTTLLFILVTGRDIGSEILGENVTKTGGKEAA